MSDHEASPDRKRKRNDADASNPDSTQHRSKKRRRGRKHNKSGLPAQALPPKASISPPPIAAPSRPKEGEDEVLQKKDTVRPKKRRTRQRTGTDPGTAALGSQTTSRKDRLVKPSIASNAEPSLAVQSKSQKSGSAAGQEGKVRRGKRGGKTGHARHQDQKILEAGGQLFKQEFPHQPAWSLSSPIGGRFIDTAPQMSSDERFVLCATETAITAYSSADSSPVNTIYNDNPRDFFTAFATSTKEPNVAWTCTYGGMITKWDFVAGESLTQAELPGHIQSIACVAADNGPDPIYALTRKGNQWIVLVSNDESGGDRTTSKILTHDSAIRSFVVRDGGKVIVAITASGLLVGTATSSSQDHGRKDYDWREITCSEPPMCFDVMVKAQKQRKSGHSGERRRTSRIDVVVGGLRGSIFVFHDILQRFAKPSANDTASDATPREQQLHWHREAVGAVAWSLDGQYIVSGGRETVLVLWQQETGRKQFLPNLESPIQDIVVSPIGASYIIRLADNSVMVLSTTELSPTCHIAGVQLNSFSRAVVPASHLPTVDFMRQFGEEAPLNTAAVVMNPRLPAQLLASAPAHQAALSVGGPLNAAPYLQTYDINIASFVSRQALARTNATNINLGPEGNSIREPNVKHLQISHDGRWLATVDEWRGPAQDVTDLSADGFEAPNSLECKLRFWLWSEEDKQWMLNSRIDEPHRIEHQALTLPVLAMSTDPMSSKFATLGADSSVRTWVLKSKLKSGKVIRGEIGLDAKGKSRTTETWWAAESTVHLEQAVAFDSYQAVRPDRGVLAFSNDGSMLAVYQHYDTFEPSPSVVHFIDTADGTLQDSRTGLYTGEDGIYALGFLAQHLIILGRETVLVWDITSFSLQATILLSSPAGSSKFPHALVGPGSTGHRAIPIPHLAINVPTNTFAIAVPESSRTARKLDIHPLLKYKTNLLIYTPEKGEKAIFKTTLPRTTMALLSAGGIGGMCEAQSDDFTGQHNGFVILDLGAEVRTIRKEITGLGALPTPPPSDADGLEEAATTEAGAMALDEEDEGDEEDATVLHHTESGPDAMQIDDDEEEEPLLEPKIIDSRPIVRREQLAEVFEHPPLAMPSMHELFDSVLRLYAEKPGERSPPPERPEEERVKSLDELVEVDVPGGESEEYEESDSESEDSSGDDGA